MKRLSDVERFDAFINQENTECWIWTGALDKDGYGWFGIKGKNKRAHRVSYEWCNGPIKNNLMLDHLCRNRACVNPDHLEAVTSRENTLRSPVAIAAVNARKTTCKRGHPFNVVVSTTGERRCSLCYNELRRQRRSRQRLAAKI